ncbi:MAG: creatininase family protein [Proteobacteria bacterium]|nr:creatininase family protein [Pseudomonadota bacterium]
MQQHIEWAALKAAELRQLAAQDAIVIVPVGSIEQHGPHLPVQVDALLCNEVAARAALQVVDKHPIVITPPVWCGLAEHHMSLGGTITLDYPVFFGLLRCICRSLVRQGFKRVLLLNGHGGNIAALNVAVGELAQEFDAPITTITYWTIAQKEYAEILERQTTVRHACEAETSMVLALAPELVDIVAAAAAKGPTEPELADAVGGGPYRWRSFAARSKTGVIGDAELANAEKGEKLLDAAAGALAKILLTEALWTLPR